MTDSVHRLSGRAGCGSRPAWLSQPWGGPPGRIRKVFPGLPGRQAGKGSSQLFAKTGGKASPRGPNPLFILERKACAPGRWLPTLLPRWPGASVPRPPGLQPLTLDDLHFTYCLGWMSHRTLALGPGPPWLCGVGLRMGFSVSVCFIALPA